MNLEDRVYQLEEEVKVLRSALGLNLVFDFPLSRNQNLILGMLYTSKHYISKSIIIDTVYFNSENPPQDTTIEANITRIRKIINPVKINCRYNIGYLIPDNDKKLLDKYIVGKNV